MINLIKSSDFYRYIFNYYRRCYHKLTPWKKMLRFWDLPRAYEDLTWAMDHALQHIQDQQKIINSLEDIYPESLINEIIDLRVQFTNENEWTATRKVWADHFNFDEEEITPEMGWTKRMEVDGYADFIQIVPAKFLTKQENDDDFDRQVDAHVTYDPIADGDLLDIVHHHLYDLKERGLYEKEIHKEAH